ncbi:hypothetical protein K2X96_03710 [Patescibacteria group bacterium]|nr:hypothetical protein [Patescibacteria group bacterium]
MSSLLRNILFAFGLAVLGWLGYTLFIADSEDLVTGDGLSEASYAGQDLLVKLQEIESVSISGEVLQDVRFESLVDFRKEVVSEPVGRDNPYLPVSGTSR